MPSLMLIVFADGEIHESCRGIRAAGPGEMPYRRTTVLLNESRGSEQYHSMKSSIACRYPRYASVELRLFRTADVA